MTRAHVAWLALIGALLTAGPHAPARAAGPGGFAVVELFSSEGCSSCPPAERLLGELADEARRNGSNILALEFHVDYWNSLGWTDPFSSAAFTARQQGYARALGLASLYTPQMIINGTDELVGSDGTRARAGVDAALARPAAARITLRATAGTGTARVNYHVAGAPRGALVCVALVESGLESHVLRGENEGRRLWHVNVVREFVTTPLPAGGGGSLELSTRATDRRHPRQVIAFVQDPRTMAIQGAAATLL